MRRSAYVSFLRSLLFPNFMNEEYQCRNSATAYPSDASFPAENFQPTASLLRNRFVRSAGAAHGILLHRGGWGEGRAELHYQKLG
ncbi:hypothetical protein C172_14590 [Paenibacillus sp. FSL H8-457]|nr:hypothetical protein C172_14590 [Paenibacillus sp. FSL H8-457]